MTAVIGQSVPWNAAWSGEARYEIRPCRWANGQPAMWSPHKPGIGRPLFAKPHHVRQRRSIAQMLCTVCGDAAPPNDRWWFRLGTVRDGYFMTTEAPVHRKCADHALKVCPHLCGKDDRLAKLPGGYSILYSAIGGPEVERDFGLKIPAGRTVIGALKIAWPINAANLSEILFAGL